MDRVGEETPCLSFLFPCILLLLHSGYMEARGQGDGGDAIHGGDSHKAQNWQRKGEDRCGGENGLDLHAAGLTLIPSFRFTAQGWGGM